MKTEFDKTIINDCRKLNFLLLLLIQRPGLTIYTIMTKTYYYYLSNKSIYFNHVTTIQLEQSNRKLIIGLVSILVKAKLIN